MACWMSFLTDVPSLTGALPLPGASILPDALGLPHTVGMAHAPDLLPDALACQMLLACQVSLACLVLAAKGPCSAGCPDLVEAKETSQNFCQCGFTIKATKRSTVDGYRRENSS